MDVDHSDDHFTGKYTTPQGLQVIILKLDKAFFMTLVYINLKLFCDVLAKHYNSAIDFQQGTIFLRVFDTGRERVVSPFYAFKLSEISLQSFLQYYWFYRKFKLQK